MRTRLFTLIAGAGCAFALLVAGGTGAATQQSGYYGGYATSAGSSIVVSAKQGWTTVLSVTTGSGSGFALVNGDIHDVSWADYQESSGDVVSSRFVVDGIYKPSAEGDTTSVAPGSKTSIPMWLGATINGASRHKIQLQVRVTAGSVAMDTRHLTVQWCWRLTHCQATSVSTQSNLTLSPGQYTPVAEALLPAVKGGLVLVNSLTQVTTKTAGTLNLKVLVDGKAITGGPFRTAYPTGGGFWLPANFAIPNLQSSTTHKITLEAEPSTDGVVVGPRTLNVSVPFADFGWVGAGAYAGWIVPLDKTWTSYLKTKITLKQRSLLLIKATPEIDTTKAFTAMLYSRVLIDGKPLGGANVERAALGSYYHLPLAFEAASANVPAGTHTVTVQLLDKNGAASVGPRTMSVVAFSCGCQSS